MTGNVMFKWNVQKAENFVYMKTGEGASKPSPPPSPNFSEPPKGPI